MKKGLNFLKLFVLILILNQFFILLSNNSIKDGWWKSISDKQLCGKDFIELENKLKYNVLFEENKPVGFIQFYIGNKILISNTKFTEWYLYQNKSEK